MKNSIFIILLLLCIQIQLKAQDNSHFINIVNSYHDACRTGDSSALSKLLHPNFQVFNAKTQMAKPYNERWDRKQYIYLVTIPPKRPWKEELWSYDVQRNGHFAQVNVEYSLFLGKNNEMLSHCGIKNFQLIQTTQGQWLISQVNNMSGHQNCITSKTVEMPEDAIHALVDNWHLAATEAREDDFYAAMTKDGIYIGTDNSERWLRDELRDWAKGAFDKAPAWDFKAKDRQVYFSADRQTAWFEERLDTWMGPCMASGVVVRQEGVWKIKHYHLSISVPNEKVKDFLKLMKKKKKRKK